MAIQDKFNRPNVIYKITKDINLGGGTLTIPEGCTLDFQGGNFSNGAILLNNTKIIGSPKIYCNIKGTTNDDIINIDWLIEDRTLDVSDKLNQAIQVAKRVELSPKSYICNNTVRLGTGSQIIGNGAEIIASGDVHLFELPFNARGNIIENMTLYTEYDSTKTGAAIKLDSANGGADQIFRDLFITGFCTGIHAENVWWNNTIENVKCTNCGTSFFVYAPNGQSINNVFIKCYSNIAKKIGITLTGVKNCLFIDCNNGLSAADKSKFLQVSANSIGVKFLGCNFEEGSTKYSSDCLFVLASNSVVNFEMCTFVALTKADESYTNTSIIKAMDTCQVTLIDCVGLDVSMDYDLLSQGNSRIYYRNLKGLGRHFASWVSNTEYGVVRDMNLPVSGVANAVDNTVYIDTGLGRLPTVTFSLLTDRAITANITERLSNGKFKLRFFNIGDGSLLTETAICDVFWVAQ